MRPVLEDIRGAPKTDAKNPFSGSPGREGKGEQKEKGGRRRPTIRPEKEERLGGGPSVFLLGRGREERLPTWYFREEGGVFNRRS